MENCPILRTNTTDMLREMQMRGGRGSKILKTLQTSLIIAPKAKYLRSTVIAFAPILACFRLILLKFTQPRMLIYGAIDPLLSQRGAKLRRACFPQNTQKSRNLALP